MKTNESRLVIEIPAALKADLKIRALLKNMTLKNWVLLAIANMIQHEKNQEADDK